MPANGTVAETTIEWTSDHSVSKKGWKLCQQASSPATELPEKLYEDLGVGKCLLSFHEPALTYHGGQGSAACQQMCSDSSTRYGYSANTYNNCILWTQSGLSGGGPAWGGAHCHAKSLALWWWPNVGTDNHKCSGTDDQHDLSVHVVADQGACQQTAIAEGYQFYSYRGDQKKCSISSACD